MIFDYEEIGRRIKRIRDLLGSRQEALAVLLRVTVGQVSLYEKGDNLTLAMLEEIAGIDPQRRGLIWLLALDGIAGKAITPQEDFVQKRRELTAKLRTAIAQGERALAAARAAIDEAMAPLASARQSRLMDAAKRIADDERGGKGIIINAKDNERPRSPRLGPQDQQSRPALKTRKRQK